MASSIPVQLRAVDPYASYNSNVVNQLTGIVTRGANALDYYNSLQVVPDSTSVLDHVEVLPGIIYKDDMLIEITSPHRVDFTDPSQYVVSVPDPFASPETGIYYVVLEYTYIKSRPAPQARIKILLPSLTATFRAGGYPSLFFLKAVDVIDNSGGEITDLYDYDPLYRGTKRDYLRNYAGSEVGLPEHDQARDQSRVAYNSDDDQFYLGYSDRWGPIGGAIFQINQGGFNSGDLVYVNSFGLLQLAQGSFAATTADGVVINPEPIAPTNVQVTGPVRNVRAEAGITLAVGNILYTSISNPGTVTNVKSTPFWQFAGRVTEIVDSTSVNILFHRGEPSGIEGVELGIYSTDTLSTWGGGGGGGNPVYEDTDISGFDAEKAIITLWDQSTEMKVQPTDIEFIDSNTLRIFMPDGYAGTLEALILGPPATTVPTSTLDKVVDTLSSGGSWLGGGPYYQDIDVSSMDLSAGSFVIAYNSLDEQIIPLDIQYDTVNNLRIWMPTNTETIKIIAVGPSSSPTLVTTMTVVLGSGGSWVSDGPLYYQDIPISSLGTDEVVFDIKDDATGERVEHTDASIPLSGTLRIWMPDNTHDLVITVIG